MQTTDPGDPERPAGERPPDRSVPGSNGRDGRGHRRRGHSLRDPWEGKRKLLAVADVQTGYHHDSISHSLATIARIGREANAFVTNVRTDSQLLTKRPIVGVGKKYGGKPVNARGLDHYDAVLLLPSGDGTLSPEQQEDLLAFVRDDGKGLIVGHAGLLAFPEWSGFTDLCGARFGGEFMATATIRVEDPEFPGVGWFDAEFTFTEQHPVLKEPYTRDDVRVILSVDPASLDPAQRGRRADDDYPVVWTRRFGEGRVFHVGWGHLESTWDDPRFQLLMLEGIRWAMGLHTPAKRA